MEHRIIESDVLIIGGGTAGCYAAIRLGESTGLRIAIAEKANIKRSGCLAAGVNALNAYITEGHTPKDYVRYASQDGPMFLTCSLQLRTQWNLEFRYGIAWQINSEPTDSKVKIFCEATARICPGNICNKHAMLRTFNAMCIIYDFNEHCSPIQSSPGAWLMIFLIIPPAPLMAERTIIDMPCIRSGVDTDMINTIVIRVEFCIFYNGVLDI